MNSTLIDTHAHLTDPKLAGDLDRVVNDALGVGVEKIITVGTTLEDSNNALLIAEQYPAVYASVGVHPQEIQNLPEDYRSQLNKLAKHSKVVAIGETGIDLFRVKDSDRDFILKAQIETFRAHLGLAVQLDLPVIIHSREAMEEVLKEVDHYTDTNRLRGVFHCFNQNFTTAKQIISRGFLVSFNGIVLYDTAQEVRSTVEVIPHNSYLLETDSPWLHPSKKGINMPKNVRLVAQEVAKIKDTSLYEIAKHSTQNAESLFDIA